MGHHEPKRDLGLLDKACLDHGMTLEVEIGLERGRTFTLGAGLGSRRLFAARPFAGLSYREPAFVGFDLTLPCDGDEDLAADFLRDLFMFPALEIVPNLQHDRIRPSCIEIALPQLGDRLALQNPEAFGVAEIALLAEQAGSDRIWISGQIEQGNLGRD